MEVLKICPCGVDIFDTGSLPRSSGIPRFLTRKEEAEDEEKEEEEEEEEEEENK